MAFDIELPEAVMAAASAPFGRSQKDATVWMARIQDFQQKRQQEVGRIWSAIDGLVRQQVVGGKWDCQNLANSILTHADVSEIIENVEAQVLGGKPRFATKAGSAKQEEFAKQSRAIIQADWMDEYTIFDQHRMACRDTITKGQGVVFHEVVTDFDSAARAKMKRDREARRFIENPEMRALTLQMQQQASMMEDATPEEDEYSDTYMWDRRIKSDLVSTSYIPLESFFRDPDHQQKDRWCFMGHTLICDFEAIKNDPLLYVPKNLKPDFVGVVPGMGEGGIADMAGVNPITNGLTKRPVQSKRALIMVHKGLVLSHDEDGCPTWDLFVITKGARKPLLYKEAVYNAGCTYNVLEWNEYGGMNFPMSDVMKAFPNILEKRDLRSRIFEKMSRSSAQTVIYDKADIPTPTTLRNVVRGQAANWIGIDNRNGKPLREIFQEVSQQGVSQSDIAYYQIVMDSLRNAVGMSANQQGMALKSETSATEADNIRQFSVLRNVHKSVKVTDWLCCSARIRLQLKAQFYNADKIRAEAGDEAAAFWMQQEFTDDNIRALRLSIERGSMTPDTDEAVAQRILGDLQFAAQFPVLFMQLESQEMLSELFLRQGFPEGSKFLRKLPQETIDNILLAQVLGTGQKQGSPPGAKSKPQSSIPDGGT